MPLPAILAAILAAAGGTGAAAGAGAGAAGAGAAGAGAAGAAGLTAGESLAAGSLTGAAMAPATGASAGMGMGAGMGAGAGAGAGAGVGATLGGNPLTIPGSTKAGGMLNDLMGQMQSPQALSPPQQTPPMSAPSRPMISPEQKAMFSQQVPATTNESLSMLLDRMGGPQGVMNMMKGTRSVHKPAPSFMGNIPQQPGMNPFDTPAQRRSNLGMGRTRMGRRFR